MAVPIEELRGIPLFDRIDDRARRLLAAEVEARPIKPGDVVFRAGEPSHAVYIVQQGAVEVSVEDEDKQRLVLYTARRGELFGELTLHQSPRASTGTAVEAGEVIELDRHDLRLLFRDSAETAIAVLEAIGEQTKRADAMLCNHTSLNVNAQFAEDQGWSGRIADAISAAAGSMPSALFHVLWFGAWIVANTLPVGIPQWDPFPFGLLTMIVSLEAIFLSLFVLLSQNRSSEHDRRRAEVDYQVNVRAELEVSLLHDKHDRMYTEVMEKLNELTERRS